jgi:Tol biopolymer transport system component
MELIEGETLKDRIKSGPIPVEEALKLALQITEALEAAHENGVIHRDLKPANIKITPDGKVKVLDFGLAKAYAGDQGSINLADSPTISAAATQQGVILGTAAYMSPEQARGKPVDRRADIWAFGVVLYEMLTGRTAFSGDDVTDTLAAVIRSEPEWKSLPANLHWRLKEVLERCLEKKARDRYSGISDARVDIQKVLSDPSGVTAQPIAGMAPPKRAGTPLTLAAVIILVAILAGVAFLVLKPTEPRQVMRFDYELPDNQQLIGDACFSLSPDGKQFVYCTPEGLYLRSIDELDAKLIPGSDDNPRWPIFSPDGKSIVYLSMAGMKLKTIAVAGGAPIVLCDLEGFGGMSWTEKDFIVYSEPGTGIMKVSSKGGTPETIVGPKSDNRYVPQILLDRELVLYTSGPGESRVMVKPFSEEPKALFAGWFQQYLPSGHIVYWDGDNNICAVQFDLDRLEPVGEHVSMIQGVEDISISNSGTLIYSSAMPQEEDPKRTLVWVDQKGNEEPLEAPPNSYSLPRISPDGKRIALEVGSYPSEDIYIWDMERKNSTKLAIDETREKQPIWTPDSKRIIYFSNHEEDAGGIYSRAFDGSGKVEKLVSSSGMASFPWSLSNDGKSLFIMDLASYTNADISMLPMEGNQERKFLLQHEYSESQPTISPDGQWMAYCSGEEEPKELTSDVYIRPFPDIEKSKTKVSTDGGTTPLWSPDGKKLFYLGLDNSVMVVDVKTEPTFSLGTPQKLFQSEYLPFSESAGTPWDIHPDGDRFIMIKPPPGVSATVATGPRKINIVLNWDEELKERVPVD